MDHQSASIANLVVDDLIEGSKKKFRERQVEQMVPGLLMKNAERMSYQMICAGQIPRPQHKSLWNEDLDPVSVPADVIAPSSLTFIQEVDGPVFSETSSVISQAAIQAPRTKRSRKTLFKQKDTTQANKGFFELSEPILNEEEQELENDLEKVKKRLYKMRKLRRQYDEEERLRLEQSLKRSQAQLPKQGFTFDFSGQIMVKEDPDIKKHLSVQTKGGPGRSYIPQSTKQKAKNDDDESSRDYLVSRQGGSSREEKRQLYCNMGKRQTSHLPFIKLTDQSKLSQNKKASMNQDTSRYTMKSNRSRGQSTFKHYTQIQKQQSERLYSMKKSSMISQITQDEVQPIQVTFSTPKRQSKMMQKYINKLYEDKNKKFVTEINKSCNFQRMNSPHDYSVHQYYRHNFDHHKKNICETSLADLNLQKSGIRSIRLTQ